MRDSRREVRARGIHPAPDSSKMHVPVRKRKGALSRFLGVRYEYEVWFEIDRSIGRSSELNE